MATGSRWTVEQVLKLAPDAGSLRAARSLASARRWSDLGSNGSLVWGRCQGSAREPYQVTVDLTPRSGHAGQDEPAFRCTCPSRKFPCKHGLALLLMWAGGKGSVAEADVADFATWSAERTERTARAEARRQARAESPPDPEARARRLAERRSLMTAGLDDFERWLFDLVRQGLAAARRQPFAYWDTAAARLVDAQVPGLAERVRAMAGQIHRRPAGSVPEGQDWADHLLAEAGRWWLAVRAWRRWDDLPADVAGDLRTVLGWSRRGDDVLEGERVADRWHVVGLRQDEDERLLSQRTWLRGERTGRMVLVLDFAAAGGTLAVAQVLGSIVEAELALYPGSSPPRARFTGDERVVGMAGGLPGATTLDGALDQAASYLAANPWHYRAPMVLARVAAVAGPPPAVVDPTGDSLPLAAEPALWSLLALSGGAPVDLFGEWYDDRLHVSSAVVDGALVAL